MHFYLSYLNNTIQALCNAVSKLNKIYPLDSELSISEISTVRLTSPWYSEVIDTLSLNFLGARDKGYGTFHEEAIRIFSSLQEQESVADPIPVIQVSARAL